MMRGMMLEVWRRDAPQRISREMVDPADTVSWVEARNVEGDLEPAQFNLNVLIRVPRLKRSTVSRR